MQRADGRSSTSVGAGRPRLPRRGSDRESGGESGDRDERGERALPELYVLAEAPGCEIERLRLGCGSCLRRARSEPRRPGRDARARGRAARRAAGDRGRRRLVVPRDRSGRLPRPAAVPQRGRRDRHLPRARGAPGRAARRRARARPGARGPRYGPRTVDLDLLLVDGRDGRRARPDAPAPAAARARIRARAARRARPGARRAGPRVGGRAARRLLRIRSA